MNKNYNTKIFDTITKETVRIKDVFTYSHINRVSLYTHRIAKNLQSFYNFTDTEVELIGVYSAFHDIGKMSTPSHILEKPGLLTLEERAIIQLHPESGFDWVMSILSKFGDDFVERPEILKNIIIQHHEYLDGSGYPFGLRGDQITPEARIVTVADIFDAMTSYRTYQKTHTPYESLETLKSLVKANKIDGNVVNTLETIIHEFIE